MLSVIFVSCERTNDNRDDSFSVPYFRETKAEH